MKKLTLLIVSLHLVVSSCIPNRTKSDTPTETVESKSLSDYEGCVVESIDKRSIQVTINFTDSSSLTIKGIKYPLTVIID